MADTRAEEASHKDHKLPGRITVGQTIKAKARASGQTTRAKVRASGQTIKVKAKASTETTLAKVKDKTCSSMATADSARNGATKDVIAEAVRGNVNSMENEFLPCESTILKGMVPY